MSGKAFVGNVVAHSEPSCRVKHARMQQNSGKYGATRYGSQHTD